MKHGHTIGNRWTREYRSYQSMLGRCFTHNNASYVRYGARGITVCARWRESFTSFLADVGPAPGWTYQLDRIDPDGNYEPGNVRWVTAAENNATRRNRTWVHVHGERVLLTEACRRHGTAVKTVEARLAAGWDEGAAVTTPCEGGAKSRDPILRALQRASTRTGVRWSVVQKRIKRGWPVRRALFEVRT